MAFRDIMNTVKNETSDAIEVTKLKTKISKEKSNIKNNYEHIGEWVYNHYKETGEAPVEVIDFINSISESRYKINDYRLEIDRVKMK